jgi:hypothetical protein
MIHNTGDSTGPAWMAYDADYNEIDSAASGYSTAANAMQAIADEKSEQGMAKPVTSDDADEVISRTEQALAEWREDPADGDLMEEVTAGMAARIVAASRDSGANLDVRPTQMDYDPWAEELHVEFGLYDGGRYVGKIQRYLRHGEPEVYNAYFTLDQMHQGTGFASAVTEGLEKWYEANGVERIKVQANIDVGGYTWAKLGFEPDPDEGDTPVPQALRSLIFSAWKPDLEEDPSLAAIGMAWREAMLYKVSGGYDGGRYDVMDVVDALREQGIEFDDEDIERWQDMNERGDRLDAVLELLEEWRQANYDAGDPYFAAREAIEGWVAATADSDWDSMPSLWEIASFGQGTDMAWQDDDGRTIWPGKAALLGTNWHGVKELGGGRW